jgi:hypothetical protein
VGFCPVNFQFASGPSISRILSGESPRLCDHLSGRRVTAPLDATYPGLTRPSSGCVRMKASSLPPSADGFVPTWSCSRRGLPGPSILLPMPVVSYTTFSLLLPSPLRPSPNGRGVGGEGATCFCGPFPAGRLLAEASPPRVLSDAVLYGVRTFLDPDNAEPRSPNRPEALSSYTQGR